MRSPVESWGFCGSAFWDNSLTWDASNPDFTECFERTALVWAPCAFLWLLFPIEFYYLRHSKAKSVSWNFLNVTKLCITVILALISIADIGYAAYLNSDDEKKVYDVSYYTPAILFISEILSGVLLVYNRKKGSVTSGLLFFFWLLLSICGVFQFRSEITKAIDVPNFSTSYYFVSYMVYYPLVLIQFILHCFADKPSLVFNQTDIKKVSPESTSSTLSRLLFAWFDKLIWLGYRKPLETTDLWPMNPEDTGGEVIPKFDKYWNILAARNLRSKAPNFPEREQIKAKEISIIWPIIRAFGGIFLFGALLKLINDCLAFVNPHVLELLINYVEDDDFEWKGYLYAIIMLISATMQTLLLSQYYKRMSLVGLRIRTALISAIYRKSLKLSNAAKRDSTTGEIVNLMAVDAQRFIDLLTYINLIWAAPFQMILALYFLWDLLGISVLAGLAVMILLIPVNAYIAKKVKGLQIKQMINKDERVKVTNEVLNGIKVLKFYCWEPSFEKRILETRDKEIKVLKAAAYFNAGTSFIWACAPFLVSLATLGTYVFLDDKNRITASIAFVSLNYFNIMRYPMGSLPMLINIYVQTFVSVQRINKFLNSEELNPNTVSHIDSDPHPLTIENGTFTWDPAEKPTLKNINLQIKNGQLVAVAGTVGSGKSSLISAFLGEMDKVTGSVNTKGSIAYVSQQAWIQNATLKDNILFGKTLDGKVYNSVVDACALKPDFDMLPGGDRTEIGEKGINLSGGQKQRVNLARAVYHNSDVYFLDDPLSAVDSHVGKHIFEKVIGPSGILRNKTRILVTHGVTYLPDVDLIVVLKDGEVSETGTYKELLDKKGAFAEFLTTHVQESEKDSEIDLEKNIFVRNSVRRSKTVETVKPDIISADDEGENLKKDVLIEEEKAEIGSVKWIVYSHYLKSMGIILSAITLLMNVAFQGFAIGSHIWLSEWTSINSTDPATRDKYLGVYGGLGVGQALASFLASICLAMGMIRASKFLHENILSRNFHAPVSFFDTTPIGRIVNRFSKDIDTVDNTLPYTIRHWVEFLFTVIATLVVISYTTPLFIAIIIPIGILYYFIQRFYIATSRQLQRMESVSRSPIYSHFGETVTGTQTIRAYNVQSRFIRESEQKVDLNQICYYPSIIANRWLAVRLEMIGNLIMFLSALFAALNRDTMNSGLVGLSVTYALQVTDTLSWLVRMTSDVETNIVAVERIKEYGETPQEAPWDNPDKKPPGDWPKNGDVELVDYKVRYRENLDLVLHGLKFRVIGGEKVGIVGRTGAGKSSLTLALFRIIEAANGKILIDGINISKLGLHDLRQRLTIIPQDPVLFSGTVRMNLDPFNKHSDEEIWRALENAHLKNFVQQLTLKLDHEVSEGGENLSVGQRQLVCLARALLRKTKILILDEATAAVDLETDDLIQKTIRTEFKECTVLTIAHRLNTILDSDRVIVLDRGLIAEFDNPQKLLAQPGSMFYSMAKDAGIAFEKNK